jgi:hypothetical protein
VRFEQVLSHVRSDLAAGKAVCLYGNGPAGALALTWSSASPVDCTVSVGARLDPSAYSRTIRLIEPITRETFHRTGRTVFAVPAMPGAVTIAPSDALLHRDLPALYGQSGSDRVADPVQWAPQLPARVMLAYDMHLRTQQQFAAESARMRAAIRKAGRNLTYYADEAVQNDDIQSRERLLGTVVDYVRGCLPLGHRAARCSAARDGATEGVKWVAVIDAADWRGSGTWRRVGPGMVRYRIRSMPR